MKVVCFVVVCVSVVTSSELDPATDHHGYTYPQPPNPLIDPQPVPTTIPPPPHPSYLPPPQPSTSTSKPTAPPPDYLPPPKPSTEEPILPMPYHFAYEVSAPDAASFFSHAEGSEGKDIRGEYRVLLPDGRWQVVTFVADPVLGYNANVTYVEGNGEGNGETFLERN